MAKKERVYKVEGEDFTTKTFAKKYGFKLSTAYARLVAYETDKNMKKLIAPVEREGSIIVGDKRINNRKLMVIHKCKEWKARAIMGAWKRGLITEQQANGEEAINSSVFRHSTDSYKKNDDIVLPEIEFSDSFIAFEKMTPTEKRNHDNKRIASVARIKVGTWEAKNL